MATIIQFPKKQTFLNQFKNKVPGDILNEMSEAYDNAQALLNNAPAAEFTVIEEEKEAAKTFNLEYRQYLLTILSRILELEAELSLAKRGK